MHGAMQADAWSYVGSHWALRAPHKAVVKSSLLRWRVWGLLRIAGSEVAVVGLAASIVVAFSATHPIHPLSFRRTLLAIFLSVWGL